jgi:hypothetical protein
MSHDAAPLHEHWRKLARLILEEKDNEKQLEWMNQLVMSHQQEMLRQEEILRTANHAPIN